MEEQSSKPKETECAVCMNDFTTPKILPCGHLLCRQCVISWVDQKPDAGCPLCRFPIADPQVYSERSSADVADVLPTDFVIQALVDNARILAKDPVCCVCDDVKAESICLHCLDMLCPACTKAHKKLAMTRSHDMESLSSVTPERLTASRPALCADHKDTQADVFCVEHGLAVCMSCSVKKHGESLGVRDLQDQMKSTEMYVKELIDSLVNAERNLEKAIARVDKRIVEVNDSEQTDTAKVDMECDRLQKLVDEYRQTLKEMSRKSHSEVRDSLYDVKRSLGQRLGMVTSHKHIAARARAVAPRPALIDVTRVLKDRINSLDVSVMLNKDLSAYPSQSSGWCEDMVRHIEKDLHTIGKQKSQTEKSTSVEALTFWLQWVEAAFPDLDFRAHFLPPVHVNPVTTGQSSAGQPPAVPNTDVRDDATLQRLLCCLQKMSEQNREVLVAMSHLQFRQYLSQPFCAATAANLTNFSNISVALSGNLSDGNIDVFLIHRQYGLVALEVMCFGENLEKLKMSRSDLEKNIRLKLKDAVSQLDSLEIMLSHVVSDVTSALRITKTIAVPNLTTRQVQKAISGDTQLTQNVCRCLGTTDPANITGLFLCSDQLSDPRNPCDVSTKVLRELGNWWQRRVAVSGPDSHMTYDLYKTLVARLCGVAATVIVPCTSPPRLCVKSLGQAVSLTGECYTAHITLFPEQVHLLNTAPPRLFVSGPPGTGKTVVLLLVAIQWLRCGNDVYIVSTWWGSRAVCILMHQLLLQYVNNQETGVVTSGQPHLLLYDLLHNKEDVGKAVNDLSQAARSGSLYVIADEAGPQQTDRFQTFCDKMLTQVPRLHLWAASCYHGDAPSGWPVEYLTRPLRSPPAVLTEVQQDKAITERREVQAYSERGVSDHTDGPPVIRLCHRGQGHSGRLILDCVICGHEVASFLHSLRVGVPVNATTKSLTPPCLQWRDVLMLWFWYDLTDQSGVVTGLREAGIPVRVMKDDDTEDVATARSDVVWVANGNRVRGLERNVVVCLDDVTFNTTRLHFMSRCTSQLVVVSPDH